MRKSQHSFSYSWFYSFMIYETLVHLISKKQIKKISSVMLFYVGYDELAVH